MVPLRSVLGEADREHLRRIMLRSVSESKMAEATSKVGAFLRDRSFVKQESVIPFQSLSQVERDKLMSDFVWRVTCHLDGSTTQVEGANNFDLASGYTAVLATHEGRDYFTLFAPRPA